MYSRNAFGNFYPVDSALHRLNPVIKLLNFIITIVLMILSDSIEVNVFLLSLVFIMALLSYVPTKFYVETAYSLRYILLILIFIFVSLGLGMQESLIYLIKLIIFVENLCIIIYTTSPSELNYGIEKFLSIFNILGLNMAYISITITNSIRYFPTMLTTGKKILKSQSSRGIDYYHSDLFGKIYAISHVYKDIIRLTNKKMKDIRRNAEIRLFNIRRFRTNLRTNRIGFYDIIFFLFHVFIVTIYLAEKGWLDEIFNRIII